MSLCTLSQLKVRLGIGAADTEHDVLLTGIITGVSGQMAGAAGRNRGGINYLEKSAHTEVRSVPEAGTKHIWVWWPIVAITEIKEALYKAWDDADALTEDTDFVADYTTGRLTHVSYWLSGTLTVRIKHTEGFTPCEPWASGSNYEVGDVVGYAEAVYACTTQVLGSTTPPPDDTGHWAVQAGELPVPAEVVEWAIKQASFVFKRRTQLGLASVSAGPGGSVSAYARDELLPEVKQGMKRYGRMMG